MSSAVQTTDQPSATEVDQLSQDVLLEVFSNQRRRFTIHLLKHRAADHSTVAELTEQIASWENNKQSTQLTTQERKRVRSALRQFHLPKLVEYGFVEYDAAHDTVCLTEMAAETDFYVDSLTGREIPWGVYYLGFSVLSSICLIGLLSGVYPFVLLSPLAYGVFFVTALSVSSVGHFYDNYYRMRLGTRDTPPEVDEL